MIKANSISTGVSVKFAGNATEILEELTAIIRGVKANFDDMFGEELSSVLIAQSGKLAFAEDEDEKDDIIQETIELLDSAESVTVIN